MVEIVGDVIEHKLLSIHYCGGVVGMHTIIAVMIAIGFRAVVCMLLVMHSSRVVSVVQLALVCVNMRVFMV